MTAIFQKIEPVSKKTRLVTTLREAIISGAIQAGEQIVEGKIAQQFGVGQGLIREALIELEHQGFVQRTPFSGTQVTRLTLEDAQQIFDLIRELNTRDKLTVFLVEQNAFHALKLAHRAYVMVNGMITLSGTGQELLNSPDVRAAYLEGGREK